MSTGYTFVCKVTSSGGTKEYTIKMTAEGTLTCNCPSWVFKHKTASSGKRTCKHVDSVLQAGFSVSERGKFLTVERTNDFPMYQPYFCKRYPDGCGECSLRFRCWVEESPTFTDKELREAGITNESR